MQKADATCPRDVAMDAETKANVHKKKRFSLQKKNINIVTQQKKDVSGHILAINNMKVNNSNRTKCQRQKQKRVQWLNAEMYEMEGKGNVQYH